jgi:hypothetical protein
MFVAEESAGLILVGDSSVTDRAWEKIVMQKRESSREIGRPFLL